MRADEPAPQQDNTHKPSGLRHVLGPYGVLWSNRTLALLFGAGSLSALIDWLYVVALFVLAYRLTHSATIVALLTFTRLLPYAALVPVSGMIADRVNRQRLMVGATAGRALCLLGLVAVQTRPLIPLAFVLVFIATLLSSLFRPALLASLPQIVEEQELVQANALLSQVDMLAFGAGPAITGLILAVSSVQVAFLLGGIGMLVPTLALARASIPAPEEPAPTNGISWRDDILAGFRFLVQEDERALLGIGVVLAGMSLANGAWWAISTVMVERVFQYGDQGLGYLMGIYAIGGLLSGFAVGAAFRRWSITTLFIASTAASSIALALFGISPRVVLPFVCLFVIGVGDVVAKVIATTVIQTATPAGSLGSVFGALESGIMFAMAIGSLIIGPLINAIGARAADVLIAAAGLLLLALSLPALLRLERVLGVRLFLRQVSALTAVPFALLDELAARFQVERVPAAHTIIRQGDDGDRFYIIRHGTVAVQVNDGERGERQVATMSARDYFGEIALLRNVPRAATVRSLSPVELYSLSREDFQDLLRMSDMLDKTMRAGTLARDRARQSVLLMRL
jgi:MFS family permease